MMGFNVDCNVAQVLSEVRNCFVCVEDKLGSTNAHMHVWKLEHTIHVVEMAKRDLECLMEMAEDTMKFAEHNGRIRDRMAVGWVEDGQVYVKAANNVIERCKKRIGGEPANDIVSPCETVCRRILNIVLCPCETVSRRSLNGDAIWRMNQMLSHRQKGSKYEKGDIKDVSHDRRNIAAALAPLLSIGSPDSPSRALVPSGTQHLRLSGFTEYRAFERSERVDSIAVMIRVNAPAYMPGSRAPVDLVLVLDASGSMRLDGKLDRVKQGSMFVIHNLDAQDRLSIVMFGKRLQVLLPLTNMSDNGKRLANEKVKSLKATGSGTAGPAMDLAHKTLDVRLDKDRVSNILLFTDGHDKRMFEKSQWYPGKYPTYTFGFGLEHDPRTLYHLAIKGCGTYSFVTEDTYTSIRDGMALCIGGLTSIVAQQVRISIGSAHQHVKISRIRSGGYHHHVEAGGKSGFIKMNDLYASEEKNFIVYVNVPAVDEEAATKLLTVTASYYCPRTKRNVGTDAAAAEKLEISVERTRRVLDRDRNISVEIASEVTRAEVFDRVRKIWLESSHRTKYNLDFRFAGRDMERQLTNLRVEIDDTKEAKAAGERWDALRSNLDDMLDARSEIFSLIDGYRDSRKDSSSRVTGLPYMLSWLSSHQWQRAVTPGSISKSRWFNFRTTRMNNMIESVDTAPIPNVGV